MRARTLLVSLLLLPLGCRTTPPDVCTQGQGLAQAVQELSQHSLTAPWVTWNEGLSRPKRVQASFQFEGVSEEEASRRFIARHAKMLHLAEDGADLVLKTTRKGKAGTYLRFEQRYQGLPVFGGEVITQTAKKGDVIEVQQLNLAHHELPAGVKISPSLSKEKAQSLAEQAVAHRGEVRVPTQVTLGIWPEGKPQLAYQVKIASVSPLADYEVFLDAETGDLILWRDRMWHANGTGQVFDPNPVASTGNTNLTDNNDATNTALNDARFSVTLPRLNGNGNTFLIGSFVDSQPPQLNQRVSSSTLNFTNFTRTDNAFEEVMIYFHIDRVQNRIQNILGFNNVNNRRQVAVANFNNQDNSFYSPGDTIIRFGSGGVDDAEDADIIVHEYGHSIQDDQVPGFGGGDEGSMGEGFGDYLAASMADVLSPEIVDPECVGDWDATSYDNRNPPCLRRVDETKHFPEFRQGEVHADGEMWSAALFNARSVLGADVMDTLVLESHFSLSSNETFFEAADAIIAADNALFFGQHVATLKRAFIEQGLSREITPPANLPNVAQSINVSIDNPRTNNVYANFTDDSKVFTQPGAAGLRVHFAQFDLLDQDASCLNNNCDNVYLYDGQGRLYQILSGNQGQFNSVVIPGDTVRIRLVSDVTVQRFGYHVDRIDVMAANGGGQVCGNGQVEGTEVCDDGNTFSGDGCRADCAKIEICGDGALDQGEACDDGNTTNGDACEANCTLPVCGNNIKDQNEQCDGNALGGQSCTGLGFAGGTLACNANCSLNTNNCTAAATCGDGAINAGEQCDGQNLNGQSCAGLGFDGGALSCNANCSLNTSACTNNAVCGDGVQDANEACDGGDLGGQSCVGLGFDGGTLSCNANCSLNTNACTNGAVCGNNTVEPGEQCDGSVGANLSCQSLGFDGGVLACGAGCALDTSGCTQCGNGIKEGAEECDFGDFGGQDCDSLGLANGTLGCSSACTLDTNTCLPAECRQ